MEFLRVKDIAEHLKCSVPKARQMVPELIDAGKLVGSRMDENKPTSPYQVMKNSFDEWFEDKFGSTPDETELMEVSEVAEHLGVSKYKASYLVSDRIEDGTFDGDNLDETKQRSPFRITRDSFETYYENKFGIELEESSDEPDSSDSPTVSPPSP